MSFDRKISALAESIKRGDRAALSKGITLLESVKADHRAPARTLLKKCLPPKKRAFRICITGAPGAGKSSFIEVFGLRVVQKGYKVGVLTIDPSSQISKGSILGDKTRMPLLANHVNAFVRPSPNQSEMGGVTCTTNDICDLLEVAGFDFILIETVGAGQSEYSGKYVADFFVLLVSPGSGDEIQGIKRGIIELADMIVVTKADGTMKKLAEKTEMVYRQANSKQEEIPVFVCSSRDNTGFEAIWKQIDRYKAGNRFEEKRKESRVFWLDHKWKEAIFQAVKTRYVKEVSDLEKQVSEEEISIEEAVQKMLELVLQSESNE